MTPEEKQRRSNIVIEMGGILPQCDAYYVHSVLYSAGRAEAAFHRYLTCLDKNASSDEIVANVHEALSHSAALSRFFWTPSKKDLHKARASRLRKLFGLTDTSPLRDRKIRNFLEHFDEYLDIFLLEHDAGHFFPTTIIGAHTEADHPINKVFKLVDPSENIFVLLNEKYYFLPIFLEVKEILLRIKPLS